MWIFLQLVFFFYKMGNLWLRLLDLMWKRDLKNSICNYFIGYFTFMLLGMCVYGSDACCGFYDQSSLHMWIDCVRCSVDRMRIFTNLRVHQIRWQHLLYRYSMDALPRRRNIQVMFLTFCFTHRNITNFDYLSVVLVNMCCTYSTQYIFRNMFLWLSPVGWVPYSIVGWKHKRWDMIA